MGLAQALTSSKDTCELFVVFTPNVSLPKLVWQVQNKAEKSKQSYASCLTGSKSAYSKD